MKGRGLVTASAFVFNLITEIEYDNGAVGVWIQSDNVTDDFIRK